MPAEGHLRKVKVMSEMSEGRIFKWGRLEKMGLVPTTEKELKNFRSFKELDADEQRLNHVVEFLTGNLIPDLIDDMNNLHDELASLKHKLVTPVSVTGNGLGNGLGNEVTPPGNNVTPPGNNHVTPGNGVTVRKTRAQIQKEWRARQKAIQGDK